MPNKGGLDNLLEDWQKRGRSVILRGEGGGGGLIPDAHYDLILVHA